MDCPIEKAVNHRSNEHRPIQNSSVIVLGASKCSSIPLPSPPTPAASPSARCLLDPLDEFSLEEQSSKDHMAKEKRLHRGVHVLGVEATALAHLSKLYEVDVVARDGFNSAVRAINRQAETKGKLVVIGVGKSGHIGKKLVATFQSLAIRAVFLHPTEALHGDLGIVTPDDTLLFISYSGKTEELFLLLPHLDEDIPTILLTSHVRPETCEFMRRRPNTMLLPAPVPELEKVSFGVSAPTSSTTVALALGDALALTAANELHPSVAAAFAKNHPGGAIGAAATSISHGPQSLGHLSTPWDGIDVVDELTSDSLALGLLRAGFNSNTGWVRVGDEIASPGKIRNLSDHDLTKPLREIPGVLTLRQQMLAMSSDTSIRKARDILEDMQRSQVAEQENLTIALDTVIAVMKDGNIMGVLEARQVFEHKD